MKLKEVNIKNRRATFDYAITDTFTAGIVLTGTEIKSIRQGKASLADTFCYVANGEVWVKNMYIAEYFYGTYNNHTERRDRKLLLNRKEIRELQKSGAYFIKTREEGQADRTIKEIVHDMFDLADAMTMSAKKDAIVNIGGFIATRHANWYEAAKKFVIPFEGYLTYGGMNGRDMEALAVGLDENTEFDNLNTRIHQVQFLAGLLDEYGIPYQRPAGGHAIFVDASLLLPNVPKEEFPAQTLTVELYREAGIRGCEIGYILADRDPVTRENRFTGLDLCRLAIPRRTYTDNHMRVVAAALKNIYDRRDEITRGYVITEEAPLMRHFTVKLAPAE